jgi:hypothetical protein
MIDQVPAVRVLADLPLLADDQMIADLPIGANVLTSVALDVVVAMIAQEPLAMFQMVVESAIHAVFVQLLWNVTHLACVQEFLNPISQNTLQVKN